MEYRITKDCGTGWGSPSDVKDSQWGVSTGQLKRAENVAADDILIHYIDYANVWAGYSTVIGPMRPNDRDTDAATRAALPKVIPIRREVWLNAGQCERTVRIANLSHAHYHRQVAFHRLQPSDAELIIAAIKAAAAVDLPPSRDFLQLWNIGAESYYKGIVKDLADGVCWLCKTHAEAWLDNRGITLPANEIKKIRGSFLDAAHITAACEDGKMEPDNLRALCPSCHRMVDRLPPEHRNVILLKE